MRRNRFDRSKDDIVFDSINYCLMTACLLYTSWLEKTGKTLAKTAEQCSATERRAQEAERDVDRYMKALYMKNRYNCLLYTSRCV